jgi:hypothetical protein
MDSVFGTSFEKKKMEIKETSQYGDIKNWDIQSFIVKANDDLRQELLALRKFFLKLFFKKNYYIYLMKFFKEKNYL